MNFETVVGLEVHVELKTDSKAFSPSPAHFGADPNANANEIDWAYPGVLPVVNRRSVEYAIRASLALNCHIHNEMHFDRKNYFYPDNPSAYQITQDDRPIGYDGYLDIEVDGKTRRIRIQRLHLEADAGKNTHGNDGYSYVDLNRQGTSLVEIVTHPDIRSGKEAQAFLEALREKLLYTEVSDVKMEEGSLRCDANVSIRPFGSEEFGNKAELKNLNSFNYIRRGIEFEEVRQAQMVQAGETPVQETRAYVEGTGETVSLRVDDEASDYRLIPEPDLPPFEVSEEWIEEICQSLPEMPSERRERYIKDYDLPEYDAKVLTLTKEMSDFFDRTVEKGADPKLASNWLMGETSAYLNSEEKTLDEIALTPENLAEMIGLIKDGTISTKMAKKLFSLLVEEGGSAKEIADRENMVQLSDPAQLQPFIDEVLAENSKSVEDYKGGNKRAIGFLVGQMMQKTKGQANPGVVNKLLAQALENA